MGIVNSPFHRWSFQRNAKSRLAFSPKQDYKVGFFYQLCPIFLLLCTFP